MRTNRTSPDHFEQRVSDVFSKNYDALAKKTDHLFGYLFIFQWLLGIAFSLLISPRTWSGDLAQTHIHVYAAIILGGLIAAVPVFLVFSNPGATLNRMVVAVSQILFSVLFIHLTGGRIETHFHVFGSLAFLAFYRDWRPVLIGTVITALDHLIRGAFWPQSVYGVLSATPWRALEHAAWVLFEDSILWYSIKLALGELRSVSESRVRLEDALATVEDQVTTRTAELNKTIHALEESESRFRSVTQTANDAIISANAKGEIISWNRGAESIFGYEKSEVLGKPLTTIIPDRLKDAHTNGMKRLQATGAPRLIGKTAEVTGLRKNGSEFPLEVSIATWNAKGEAFYSGILRDISERKNNEARIMQQNQVLAASSKMSALGEMAGGIAHEINNPLATIKSLSSQLQEVIDDDPLEKPLIKDMAVQIEKTTSRIAKIVQGLRSFSRDGSNDPFQPVNVHQLIEETLSFCNERFKNFGTQILVEDFDKTICFEGRSTEISQVLLNLLNNAHDAVLELKEKWIKVSVVEQGSFLSILITDCGKGVPLEIQDRIFQPFFTTKEIGKGTGMGLSISMGIVQQHNGELKLDTGCENTCFLIRLPKKQSTAKL